MKLGRLGVWYLPDRMDRAQMLGFLALTAGEETGIADGVEWRVIVRSIRACSAGLGLPRFEA